MTTKKKFIAFIAAFAAIAIISGCGHLETYGEKISNRNMTAIKNIVMHPQDYEGKTVTVKGKITMVCETGCWFNLKDQGATIYTDLAPSGFAIPQNVGKEAIAEGRISIESGRLTLTAKGVEIR